MKTKLFLALGLLCLSLLINTANPQEAWAACSGDDCGCYLDYYPCMDDCQQYTGPSYTACTTLCRQESVNCARACCGW